MHALGSLNTNHVSFFFCFVSHNFDLDNVIQKMGFGVWYNQLDLNAWTWLNPNVTLFELLM